MNSPELTTHMPWGFFVWKELSVYPGGLHHPSLCTDCLVYYASSVGGMVSNGSVTLVLIDYFPIHLDRDLNSHRSGIQEFPEIYLMKINDCIMSHINGFLDLFFHQVIASMHSCILPSLSH